MDYGSAISQGFEVVSDCFTQATTMIVGNPIAMTFVCFGLVGGGIALFRKVRKKS